MKSKIFISFKNIQVAIKIPKKNNHLNRFNYEIRKNDKSGDSTK